MALKRYVTKEDIQMINRNMKSAYHCKINMRQHHCIHTREAKSKKNDNSKYK